MTLTLVKPDPQTHVNVLLYGPPGSGKSTAAASAPKPLLYLNGDSPNATRFGHGKYEFDEAHVESLQTLIDATEAVRAGEYRSLVLDTLGDAYRHVLEGISGRSLHPQIQMYGDTGTHIERFCRAMVELPINFVVTAHELRVKDEDTGAFDRMPFGGTNNPALAAKLMAAVDVVGYTGVVQEEGQPLKYVAQLVDGAGRRGKDRFGVLGISRELDLNEWFDTATVSTEDPPAQEAA